MENGLFRNHFSIALPRQGIVKSRAIVLHEGDNRGLGVWQCSKKDDGARECQHIEQARRFLRARGYTVEDTEDTTVMEDDEFAQQNNEGARKRSNGTYKFFSETEDAEYPSLVSPPEPVIPVSYLSIMPPAWAALSTDKKLYERPRGTYWTEDNIFKLDSRASCPFGGQRTIYNPVNDVHLEECTIYTLTHAVVCKIELQQCPLCKSRPGRVRRHIGPETRDLGVFNYNNRILCTHDLLDDYTCAYTSSETPFIAWTTVMSRRYSTTRSPTPFLDEETFRNVWFAYVNLQAFEEDMSCRKCGPTPDDTIWDGVTLAFHEKRLLPTLRPPTTVHEDSVIRTSKYVKNQQILKDAEFRKKVLRIIKLQRPKRGSRKEQEKDVEESTDEDETGIYEEIPGIVNRLKAVNSEMGRVFEMFFGQGSFQPDHNIRGQRAVKELFVQVS
jgi:hypothetical protein